MTFRDRFKQLFPDQKLTKDAKAFIGDVEDFVIEHINDRDEWDQEWPEIGHKPYGDGDCRCVHCE